MASGTKIRTLTRLLDSQSEPLWVIGPTGKLVYLSAGAREWLDVDVDLLIDRNCVAGVAVSDDPLDALAASLSPPPGLSERGTAGLVVRPPTVGARPIEPKEVRFLRLGDKEGLTVAVGGHFQDRSVDHEIRDAVAVRQRLDAWRKRHAQFASVATAGVSPAARRLRSRLQVAASCRTHVGFYGPTGSGSESIAARIHQLSAPGEAIVRVEGPLMDPELLDATMTPLIHQLAESAERRGTALVCGLDEMPGEAQQRLADLIATYSGRLRLLALCSQQPNVLAEPLDEVPPLASGHDLSDEPARGIDSRLVETLSALSVVCQPLASRVEDIPLLAAAVVDARHAAGEGPAERLNRAALDALVVYPWPGNFEELDASIRHAMRTAPSQSIGVEHLPLAIRSFRVAEPSLPVTSITSLDKAMQQFEWRLIREALEATGGNRAEAARRLGISRARLLRRIEESGD